jgi:hypothetical protein
MGIRKDAHLVGNQVRNLYLPGFGISIKVMGLHTLILTNWYSTLGWVQSCTWEVSLACLKVTVPATDSCSFVWRIPNQPFDSKVARGKVPCR